MIGNNFQLTMETVDWYRNVRYGFV